MQGREGAEEENSLGPKPDWRPKLKFIEQGFSQVRVALELGLL
jgi:hypothetical protein